MKKIITLSIVLASAFSGLFAQNEIKIEPYKKANLCCNVKYKLVPSTENKIVLQVTSDDQNIENYIKLVQNGDVINIRNSKKIADIYEIHLYFTELNSINASSNTEIYSTDTIYSDNFALNLTGASEAQLVLKTKNLNINMSGASEANLSGYAQNAGIVTSGASEFKGNNFYINNSNVMLSGASDASLHVKNTLSGTLSGASDLRLLTNPEVKNLVTSGNSTVIEGAIAKNSKGANSKITIRTDTTQTADDTTNFDMGQYQVKIIKKGKSGEKKKEKFSHNWAGFDLGMNAFMHNNSINMPDKFDYLELNRGRSWNFGINFLERDVNIHKEYVNLVTGMGLEFANFNLKNNYNLIDNNGLVAVFDSTRNLHKNKLRTSYLNVPLLLEFNTNSKKSKSFHISTGVIGGIRLGSSLKQVEILNGRRYKNTFKDDFSLQDFKLMATFRVGYGNFNAFVNYGLFDLFRPGKGPDVIPVTVGVTLAQF
jgi:hypothetical protein